jgi:hypothetical protein
LGYFNAKVSKEDIFKTIIESESLHEIINDNGDKISELCHISKLLSQKYNVPTSQHP